MIHLPLIWRFRESELDASRLARVSTPICPGDLLNLLIGQIGAVHFQWRQGDNEARKHHRAEFLVPYSQETCDIFFNGISGVRAHYYRGTAEGEWLTRYLISGLTDTLVGKTCEEIRSAGTTVEIVRASLAGVSAKIWIDESNSNLDQRGVDAEALIVIEVPHWVKAARKASEAFTARKNPSPTCMEKALLGVQVPTCSAIGIFGAWLNDRDVTEFRVPSKRNRARHIRVYGFS